MSARRAPGPQAGSGAAAEPTPRAPVVARRSPDAAGVERIDTPPRSQAEAEAQYVAARNAWTAAMRRASSGRPADLASLAIAQEAYEMASAQRDGWQATGRTAIPIGDPRPGVDVIARQDLAWRRVRESARRGPRLLGRVGRFVRRVAGRGRPA